jgi:predicted nucleic acid-binding protein
VASELSVFHGIRFRTLRDPFPYSRIVASAHHTSEELDKLRDSIFATDIDSRFNEIKWAAGGNKNDDAFHILSAERASVDYFVTSDKKLINSLRNQQRIKLAVKVVYPSELLRDVRGISNSEGLSLKN